MFVYSQRSRQSGLRGLGLHSVSSHRGSPTCLNRVLPTSGTGMSPMGIPSPGATKSQQNSPVTKPLCPWHCSLPQEPLCVCGGGAFELALAPARCSLLPGVRVPGTVIPHFMLSAVFNEDFSDGPGVQCSPPPRDSSPLPFSASFFSVALVALWYSLCIICPPTPPPPPTRIICKFQVSRRLSLFTFMSVASVQDSGGTWHL